MIEQAQEQQNGELEHDAELEAITKRRRERKRGARKSKAVQNASADDETSPVERSPHRPPSQQPSKAAPSIIEQAPAKKSGGFGSRFKGAFANGNPQLEALRQVRRWKTLPF